VPSWRGARVSVTETAPVAGVSPEGSH